MIQFFVEDKEVVLPSDFEFDFIENNPEINAEGDITLDVTVSMKSYANQKAFNFINRVTNTALLKSTNGRLIEDGVTRFGIIIVLSYDQSELSFQFVSGNSAINYISQSETKVYELDWGSEAEITLQNAVDSVLNATYTKNYICCPIQAGSTILNEYNFDLTAVTDDLIVMQPYLLYYINKLPEVLGYTLTENHLNDDARARIMYLVNPNQSLNYSDALPDMTLAEFMTAIEDFFNVCFKVSSKDKTIRIVRSYSELSSKTKLSVKPINGIKIDQSDDDTSTKFSFTKIKYTLPSNMYFNYHRLSDEIMAKMTIINQTYGEYYPYSLSDVNSYTLFRMTGSLRDYLIKSGDLAPSIPMLGSGIMIEDTYCYMYQVNRFADYGTEDSNTLELKVSPAAIIRIDKPGAIIDSGGSIEQLIPMPNSSNDFFIPSASSLIEVIEQTSAEISRPSVIEVALYSGLFKLKKSVSNVSADPVLVDYPFSHVDADPERSFTPSVSWAKSEISLRLNGQGSIVEDYRHSSIFDVSKRYVTSLIDNKRLTPDCLLYIEGGWYCPIKLERKKNNKRVKSLVKATLYKLK